MPIPFGLRAWTSLRADVLSDVRVLFIRPRAFALALERDGAGIRARLDDGTAETFDAVIFATGREPNTRGLGLAEAGVKLGRKGEVIVDRWSQTSIPSIFAVGDVTDRVNLTPVAIREGHAFAHFPQSMQASASRRMRTGESQETSPWSAISRRAAASSCFFRSALRVILIARAAGAPSEEA